VKFEFPITVLVVLALVAHPSDAEVRLDRLFPSGAQRNSTLEVEFSGEFPEWPVNVWVSRPGVEFSPLSEAGDSRRLLSRVSADAELGIYWVRVFNASGASALRPFIVGTAKETVEQEPNNSLSDSQRDPYEATKNKSIVFNGRLAKSGDVDMFSIQAEAGDYLVADVDARDPLGSDVDIVMQLVSPDGFVVAHNDDQQSLDPRITFRVPKTGRWHVRLFGFPATPNSTIRFAGSDSYVYRLFVTTGPTLNYSLPLAVQSEGETRLKLFGWNLAESDREHVILPRSGSSETVFAISDTSQPLRIPVVPRPVVVEPEAHDETIPVDLPVTITGRIETAGNRDCYEIQLRAKESMIARLESRELGFPLDGVLEIEDPEGKSLKRVDDTNSTRDVEVDFTATEDGVVRVCVEDLHGNGGDDFVYRLTLTPTTPSFKTTTSEHQVIVKAGASVEIPVQITRQHNHQDVIRLMADGLPAGIQVDEATSEADKDSAKEVKLKLTASEDAAPYSGPIRLVANDNKQRSYVAIPLSLASERQYEIWLTVTPPEKAPEKDAE